MPEKKTAQIEGGLPVQSIAYTPKLLDVSCLANCVYLPLKIEIRKIKIKAHIIDHNDIDVSNIYSYWQAGIPDSPKVRPSKANQKEYSEIIRPTTIASIW